MIRERQGPHNVVRMVGIVGIFAPARHSPAGGAQPPYRPGACLRQPHWQLVCSQRQAFAWHPQTQDEQSQVPQQFALAIFALDFFISAMGVSFEMPTRDCIVTEADGAPPETLQFCTQFGKLLP